MRKTLLFAYLLLFVQQAFSQASMFDPSFGNGGITAPLSQAPNFDDMAIQPDGKIVAFGHYQRTDGGDNPILVRYNTNGTLDKTFSNDGIIIDTYFRYSFYGLGIAVQKDGKILAAGPHYNNLLNDGTLDFGVTRYNANGSLDTTFGVKGRVSTNISQFYNSNGYFEYTDDFPTSIAIESNGNILVAGTCDSENSMLKAALVRYTATGSLESIQSFYSGLSGEAIPRVVTYASGGYALQANGADYKVYFYSSKFGEKALGLSSNISAGIYINRFTILKDEKIALVTNGTSTSGAETGYITLLNANGSPNSNFSGNGIQEVNFTTLSVAAQQDGKIIVSGYDPNAQPRLERYKTDGSLDYSFPLPPGDPYLYHILVYGNRLYALASGTIIAYQLDANPRMVKVNLYGNYDPYVNREWNNWNNLRNLHFNNFYYSDSTISNISAVMSNRNGVNDNGADYGSGMAPAGVLRHSSYAIGSRTVTLSGLTTGKKYSIELYASRNAYSDNSTVFSINGVSKNIATYRNFTNKAVFANLTPNAQGQIVITISSTKMYNYLNGFTITESFTTSAQSTQVTTMAKRNDAAAVSSELQLRAYPNPARQTFTLQLKSSSNTPVQLRVVDAAGRVVETKQNIASNTSVSIGAMYKPGVYYAETIQGTQRKLTKLVKEAE